MSAKLDFPIDCEGFDSHDNEILIVDGPGDTTVRPARPVLLALALAERERMARWQQEKDPDVGVPPADRSESTNQ